VLDYVLGNDYQLPPTNLAGVILSSPALRPPRGVPNIFQQVIIVYNYHVNASFGSHTDERTLFLVTYEQLRNILMTPIFYLTSLTRVPIDNEWAQRHVTDDPWEQIGFQSDPLTIRSNPLNFIYQIQEHMLEIRDLQERMSVPYLLMYAQGDQIVNPAGAAAFALVTRDNHELNRVVPIADTHSHELFRARPAVRERLFTISEEWIDQVLAQWEGR
jgi:alpha-beta hydrolase superfamily lysophospholipase